MERSLSPRKVKVKGPSPIGLDRPDARALLRWYDKNRRRLPWRALPGIRPDAYGIWLSEVMLQQTTVATVIPYYKKFLQKWPTLKDLASATEDDVLRMWAGLGYYSRARALHACSRILLDRYRGVFPQDYQVLLALPGFGPYTAAAVAAIAFDGQANVVDGNVERVMARIFAVRAPLREAKKVLRDHALSLLPTDRFGDYAQALMDLGATVCTPRQPKCAACPWKKSCRSLKLGLENQLPTKSRMTAKPKKSAIAFVLKDKTGAVMLQKRPPHGLLASMMEVPSTPWVDGKMPNLRDIQRQAPASVAWTLLPKKVRHIFSHFELELGVAVGTAKHRIKGTWVREEDLTKEALPSLMRKVLHHAKDV